MNFQIALLLVIAGMVLIDAILGMRMNTKTELEIEDIKEDLISIMGKVRAFDLRIGDQEKRSKVHQENIETLAKENYKVFSEITAEIDSLRAQIKSKARKVGRPRLDRPRLDRPRPDGPTKAVPRLDGRRKKESSSEDMSID